MTVKHIHPGYPDENTRKQQISAVYCELCQLLQGKESPSSHVTARSPKKQRRKTP
ncbi:hypothetical protein [Marasmitruncus massiliensis]|uniref:hypothetical protein n=1 Tax=Marasmitruncus massiliensis TaxID=1944642 RepID=UPI0015E1166F|nr:hypothetical protein [Marasmitruncus massiliensis]